MLFKIGRNNFCPCKSGLKYKRCCANKSGIQEQQLISEEYTILYDQMPEHEFKDERETLSPEDSFKMAALLRTLRNGGAIFREGSDFFFQELYALQKKYPREPSILQAILGGYQTIKDYDKAEAILNEMETSFPRYLFAKFNRAMKCLDEDQPEKVPVIFNGAHTLKQLRPDRTVFHISEVLYFHEILVRYFAYIGKMDKAQRHYKILTNVSSIPSDYDTNTVVRRAQKHMERSFLYEVLNAIREIKQEEQLSE